MRNLLLLFVLLANVAISQTTVPAGNVSGTWTFAGSPYNVTGHITIPVDSTLIIQPGVSVVFQGHYKFNIQGKIQAIGTIADTIIFTANDTTTGWYGMRFNNTSITQDSSLFVFCKLQWGKANGVGNDELGGAFFINHFSKIRIEKCRIYKNSAKTGGGIYGDFSSPNIFYNKISNNSTFGDNGGGIYFSNSAPIINYNIIVSNLVPAMGSGGGIWCNGSSIATIIGNTISNNYGAVYGGGIYCNSPYNISNNTITFNSNGGIFSIYNGDPCTIINNTIAYNSNGPGINCQSSSPNIFNNKIVNNSANDGGGIRCAMVSHPVLKNNVIANNNALRGGAFFCDTWSTPNILNCTITNNLASSGGGAIYCMGSSNPIFSNVIIWGNVATSGNGNQVYLLDNTSNPNFTYCNVHGASSGFFANSGDPYTGNFVNNINLNPFFVSPSGGCGSGFNGLTVDWSLQTGSPCIDSGDPTTLTPSTDLAGNPRVTVCRIDIGAYEFQQVGLPFTVSTSQILNVQCNGLSTGSIVALATGGGAPYNYLWSYGNVTNDTLSSIGAGTYTVTATNTSGCVRTSSITVTQPSLLSITPTSTNIDCSGNCIGSVGVSASGGNPQYTYLWNTVPPLTSSSSSATLCSGTYTVTVTDSQGCTKTANAVVSTPSSLSFTTGVVHVNCFAQNNGSISVNATGGSGTKQYSKDGGVNYQLSNNFTGLIEGTYNIVVKDGNGCQTSVIPVTITEPPQLTSYTTKADVDCYGAINGSATVNVSGGTPVYSILWNTTPSQSTMTIQNLSSGQYYVTITDSHGCSKTDSVTIVATLPNFPICLVSVDTISWKNKIMWEPIPGLNILGFNVYKEIATNVYSGIGFVSYGDPCFLIDYSSNPVAHGDKYKIAALDSCTTESSKSPYHKTMNLTIAAFGSTMGLNWDSYVDESGIFIPAKYYIYRGANPTNMTLLDSISGSFTSYNDANVFNVYYYIIGVKKDPPCDINGSLYSYSNQKDNSTLLGINTPTYGNISVCPNPFSDYTTITIPNYQSTTNNHQLVISDVTGKTVRTINLTESKPYTSKPFTLTINREDLKAGVYFVELRGDRVYRGKLIVE